MTNAAKNNLRFGHFNTYTSSIIMELDINHHITLHSTNSIAMELNLVTAEDLQHLKLELICEIKKILHGSSQKTWLRSQDVEEMLNISPSTLHNLREKKILPHSKVGGIILYEYSDIIELLRKNKIK